MAGRAGSWRCRRSGADVAAGTRARTEDALDGAGGLRWPWALLAAGSGAAGGAAVALLVRRHLRSDPPGAQELHELRAVVDRPADQPPA